MRPDAAPSNLGGLPCFPARSEFASPQHVLQSGTVQLGTPLPLSGSGRAVLADPIGRSMLGSLRLAVQTGRMTAEDAANQLAGYLRSRDVSSPAVGPAHGFAAAPGSNGGYGEGSYSSYGHWAGNGQMQPMAPGPGRAAGSPGAWPQWHAAAGAAGQQTASAEPQSQPHGAKRAGRRPLYARGSNSSDNGHEQAQDRDHGVSDSNGNVAGAFAGLSLHANTFQPRMQLGLGEQI